MGRLTLKQSKRLVLITWLEILVSGAIVMMAVNPFIWYLIVFAIVLAIHALVRFIKKSGDIPVRSYSVVPTVFAPSAFFAILIALIFALFSKDGILCPLSLGLGFAGIIYFIASAAERY